MTRRKRWRDRPTYSKHGLVALENAMRTLESVGGRVTDPNTAVGRALAAWRRELVDDLGGEDRLSTAQRALVEVIVRQKLLLDSIDTWLLEQPRLVNLWNRGLLPAVTQRQTLADGLLRMLREIGLERRARDVLSPEEARHGLTSASSGSTDP